MRWQLAHCISLGLCITANSTPRKIPNLFKLNREIFNELDEFFLGRFDRAGLLVYYIGNHVEPQTFTRPFPRVPLSRVSRPRDVTKTTWRNHGYRSLLSQHVPTRPIPLFISLCNHCFVAYSEPHLISETDKRRWYEGQQVSTYLSITQVPPYFQVLVWGRASRQSTLHLGVLVKFRQGTRHLGYTGVIPTKSGRAGESWNWLCKTDNL